MIDDQQIEEKNDGLEDDFPPNPPLNKVNKNQKIAVAGLAVFAVLIVVLWSVQLKNNIYGPFNSNVSNNVAEPAPAADQTINDLALKNKDTDGDGLSDYDELYIYKTSPYLEDSDGDGLKDGEEIKKGTDPNCPAGRTCVNGGLDNSAAAASSSAPASSADTLNSLLNQANAVNPTGVSVPPPTAGSGAESLTAEQKQALKNIDVASLRQMLLEAGIDKAVLDQISDQELMQSYNETLQ